MAARSLTKHSANKCIWNSVVLAVVLTCALWTSTLAEDTTTPRQNQCGCQFPKHNNPGSVVERLKPLCNKRFSAEDDNPKGYKFEVGICTHAEQGASPMFADAGALQIDKDVKMHNETIHKHKLGKFSEAEVMAGTNWMILIYEGGEPFHSHCTQENRRAIIMIMCKKGETTGVFRWVEENSNKTNDCYYLFELEHDAACSQTVSGFSIGSVVCIVVFVVATVYLLGGFLFMRFFRGAKGLHQIPNYRFWRDFGALQADGCDFICRCGGAQQQEAKYYHGIGDRQIESAGDSEDVDEHLLPM